VARLGWRLVGRLTQALAVRLADQDAERVRVNHELQIAELQALPVAGFSILPGVTLKNGVATQIAHKLGRTPAWCRSSDPRASSSVAITTTGRIVMLSRDPLYVTYVSTGWGTDVTIDLVVG